MKLFAVAIFLVWTAAFPFGSANHPLPGIVVKLSENGIQYAATKIMDWVDSKIDPGMHFPDVNGSLQHTIGSTSYVLTNIEAKDFSWFDVSGGIVPGVGIKVSFRRISVTISGNFSLEYSARIGSLSNSGTFNLMLSSVSLNVRATAGMAADGQPTVDFPSCSASIGNIDLDFKAESANWLLEWFTGSVKEGVKPTLINAICRAVKDARKKIDPVIAKNVRPSVDMAGYLQVNLHFVSPPVFGKGFIEAAFRGDIFTNSESTSSPYNAEPFTHSQVSKKMADVYVSAYVLNTMADTLHRNDKLTNEFTKDDLPPNYRYVMNTSCKDFCVGKILPDIFAPHPASTVEFDVATTKSPVLKISSSNCSVTFAGNINIQIRSSSGSVTTLGGLSVEGSVTARALTNSDSRLVFVVNKIPLTSASIRVEGAGRGRDVKNELNSALEKYLRPKLNEFGQKGFSKLHFGRLSASNASLKLIENAFVLMTDVVYSNAATTSLETAALE